MDRVASARTGPRNPNDAALPGAAPVPAPRSPLSRCYPGAMGTAKAKVFDSFNQVAASYCRRNGIIGNPIFSKVKDLGSTAQRFEADAGVTNIATRCGHPLGLR